MRTVILAFFLAFSFGLTAQADSLKIEVMQLSLVGRMVLEHPEFAVRDSANQAFKQQLKSILKSEGGYEASLKKVTNMIALEGENFKVFTWQIPNAKYNYVRHGLVAAKTKRGIRITELKDKGDSIRQVKFRKLRPKEWPGALYYQIVPVKEKGKTTYTLLGYASGPDINKKIIDVITVSSNGQVKFGDKKFYVDKFNDKVYNKPPMRLILRYSAKYASSVRWFPQEEMIVMDHLSPPPNGVPGLYSFYGPDFSYDGLYWKDGWWHLEENPKFNTGQNAPIVPPSKGLDLIPNGRAGR